MAVKFTNNARTTLAADISNSATTATVTSGSVFPVLNAGEYFYCTFDNGTNNEIVKVTARSGNTLTIVRGVDNTTARAFSTDDAAELRATAGLLTDIQENIAAKSANQTVYNATTASSATDYDIGIDPGLESNAMVFLNGVMQHHDTFSFSGSTLTFDTAPSNGLALEVIVDNLINLQSSNLTVDTFTAADVGGNPQVDFVLSDAPAGETNLIVFVDGVFQANDTYTISSTTLSMTDGVTADMVVTVYVMNPVNIGAPSDNTVTSSKLSGNITMPADLTVTGDVAFDSPTFVVDNANSRVGIGTASPSTLLDIVGDVKMSANLTVDTTTLVVDATNNRVGIGTSNPSYNLHVEKSSPSANVDLLVKNTGTDATSNTRIMSYVSGASGGDPKIGLGITGVRDYFWRIDNSDSDKLILDTNGTDVFTIDTSGNLLVGKTSGPNYNLVGIDLTPLGEIQVTGNNRIVATFNRQTTDGDIAVFRKDGSTVGSIGVNSGDIYIASTGTYSAGLMFEGSSGAQDIRPCSSAGALLDGSVDLGDSTARFKDLYLSGTANVGKADVITSIQPELHFSSTYVYSNNRDWRFITNNFGNGNWGGFSLERSTGTQGTPSVAMFGIDLAGNMGLGVGGASGVGQPSAKLHIKQSADKSEGDSHLRIEGSGYSGFHWLNGTAYYIGQNSNSRQLRMYSGSNEAVGVYLTNGGNSWSSYSDERLKENIQDIGSVIEKIKDIRCVTYTRKDVDDENKHETIGFIAQDFVGKFDQVLDESKVLDSDEETRYSMRYTETVPILMKAIQEQQELINNLTSRIETLEG